MERQQQRTSGIVHMTKHPQATVSEARSMRKDTDKSRFVVLEDITEEDTILESIQILKQKIWNIPVLGGTKDQAHDQIAEPKPKGQVYRPDKATKQSRVHNTKPKTRPTNPRPSTQFGRPVPLKDLNDQYAKNLEKSTKVVGLNLACGRKDIPTVGQSKNIPQPP